MLGKITNYVKGHRIISAVIVLVVVFFVYYSYKKARATDTVSYVIAPVQKQTIISTVSGTGQVSASNQIDIKPQSSGVVIAVPAVQGQQIKEGTVLAILDQQSANNQILSAKASLAQAQANYQKVIAGSTSDDIALANLAVNAAQQSLDSAKNNYSIVSQQQQQLVNNANATLLNSNLEIDPSDVLTTATVTLSGNYTGNKQGQFVVSTYLATGGIVYTVSGLGNQNGMVIRGLPMPLGNGIFVTFGATGTISNTTTWTVNVPNQNGSSYISNLNSYNNALQNQRSALVSAQNQIDTAQNQLQQAQVQLNQKTAPAASADVAAAQAQIASAQAALANAYTAYRNNEVISPIDGILAKINVVKGQQAGSGDVAASVITHQQLAEISLNEVDVAKIKAGDKVNLTFDAVDGLSITGEVAQIDTIGTVSQGVVTYNVKIAFDTQDDRVKPGMSVSADIITDVKTDVLTVPNSAVKSDGSGSYVQILDNTGKPQDRPVQVGISNDTDTEIISGLSEGNKIVTQTVTSAAAKTTSNSNSPSSFRLPGLSGGGGGLGAGGGVRLRGN